jgi:membrane protease YdiL (CAAX protease family)
MNEIAARTGVAALTGPRVLALLALAMVLYVAVLAAVMAATAYATAQGAGNSVAIAAFLVLLALQPVAFVGTGYVMAIRVWGLSWSDFGVTTMARKWFLLVPLFWVLALPVVGALKFATDELLGTPGSNPYADTFDALGPASPGLIIAVIVLGGIIVPASEEFLFRGLLYPWLRSRLGIVVAALISAAFFSLLHLHPAILAPIFVLGVVLALLREYSGSLWPSILFHAIHNTAMFVTIFSLLEAGIDLRSV